MAKRFTDTQKYHKHFIRSLQGAYKLFWDFLYCECNHAGLWIVDFEIAQILLGKDMPINKNDALKYFNEDEKRIIEIDEGKKWFIPSFIEFQYGELNPDNRAHKSVISILKKYNLYNDNKGLISPLQGRKDMDKDKDKDKDKEGNFSKFLNSFNEITERNFKGTDKARKQFNARKKEGFVLDDFIKAITNCKNDPFHKENPKYLTPEFITRSDKLQMYLNTKKEQPRTGASRILP